MTTQIELRDVVAVQINDTSGSSSSTTTWREIHFHKANGEVVTVTVWPHKKGGTVSVVIGNEKFVPNLKENDHE